MTGFDTAETLGLIVGGAVFVLVLVYGWWFVTDTPVYRRSRLRTVLGYVVRTVLILAFAPSAGVVLGLAAYTAALVLGSL